MNKPIETKGNLELVRLENQKLEVYGWIASINLTPVQNFNITIDTQKIEDFEQTLGIPSPDVNQIHPHLGNSAKARFRLVIPLNSQQIEQYQKSGIALTPIFSEGKGKVILHNVNTTTPANKSQSDESQQQRSLSLLPDKISQTTNTLPSVGNLDRAIIQNQQLRLSGWVASLNSGPVEGFEISIAGQAITEFEYSLGLPSPDVKKAFPKLDNAEVARFQVIIPISQPQIEQFDDSVVALTPLFKDGKGVVMVKVISVVGGGNKTVNHKIVDSHVILSDGKSIPVPPTPLIVRVHGDSQINGFLQAGWEISRDLKAALKKIGKEFSEFDSVLDFGCGCGRVIIWNSLLSNSTSLYGTDIDAEAISWSQENLEFAKFRVNQALPPIEYEDNQFDLVYLISVFTHINEEMQLQWLQELRRITKPEGIVLITTRRPNTRKEAYELATKLETDGLVFVPSVGEKKIFPDWYKTTYQTEDYVRNRWASEFEIIDYLPGGIRGNQDIVILRNNQNREQEIESEQISETQTLLPTTGYVEQVEISQENQLSIKGWVAAVNSGILENMKVILGGVEIENFQLKKGIPSPDVKKSNSHLDAENARFELSIPLNSQQLEQCLDSDLSLTPFFQKGEGTVILKQLILSLPKPQIQQEIESEQISETQTLLPTTGYVEQVEISQENQLSIKGWVAA
ncbi:MAG: class I SAM-dependent methyltransferase, partial [Cyanobacteriota bacterium]|nr:class I SAM-dependent methyltransferase [Cyanobacteriota bacterium]